MVLATQEEEKKNKVEWPLSGCTSVTHCVQSGTVSKSRLLILCSRLCSALLRDKDYVNEEYTAMDWNGLGECKQEKDWFIMWTRINDV